MRNESFVSVLMCVFNGEDYVEEAVLSVLRQDYTEFEFIIIDDGSTDRSNEVLRRLASLDSRIVLLEKHNEGLVRSLNFGLTHCSGRVVARIDADDRWSKFRLSSQIQFFHENKNLVLSATRVRFFNNDSNMSKVSKSYSSQNVVAALNSGQNVICHSSVMFRRQTVENANNYDERMFLAEDYDLWLRLSEVGQVMYVNTVLVDIRVHNQQISSTRSGFPQIVGTYLALYMKRERNSFGVLANSSDFQKLVYAIEEIIRLLYLFDFGNNSFLKFYRKFVRKCFIWFPLMRRALFLIVDYRLRWLDSNNS